MGFWESDPLVVLGGRESGPHGEAVDKDSQHAKETGAGHAGLDKRLPTSLQAIANKAKTEHLHRFRGLYALLNKEFLLQTWRSIRKNAALAPPRASSLRLGCRSSCNLRRAEDSPAPQSSPFSIGVPQVFANMKKISSCLQRVFTLACVPSWHDISSLFEERNVSPWNCHRRHHAA